MIEKKEVIVGFDISSTIVGYCILDINGEIVENDKGYELGAIVFKKESSLLERGILLEEKVLELTTKFRVKTFYLEDRLKAFQVGKTNAEALFKTAAMNFLSQFLFFKKDVPVVAINVNTARKLVIPGFHTMARTLKGIKHKEIVFNIIVKQLAIYPDILPTKILKSGTRKGAVTHTDAASDMVDAWVIAKAGLLL